MNKKRAQSLLDILTKISGIPPLDLSDTEVCTIVFDEQYEINIGADENTGLLTLFCHLPTVSQQGKLRAYELMLNANLFSQGTSNITLSLHKETNCPVVSRTIDVSLVEYDVFEAQLLDFIDCVELWSNMLKDINSGEADTHDTMDSVDVKTAIPV